MKNVIKWAMFLMLVTCSVKKMNAQRIQQINGKKIVNPYYSRTDQKVLKLSNAVWKKVLNENLFAVSRLNETEMAFSGKYNDFEGIGTYYCAACGNPLFRSDAKFATTCGWPSFLEPIRPKSVIYKADNSYQMQRTEVRCGRCNAHLGHVFDDGPKPTKKRFCMNSVSLEFEPMAKKSK